MDFLIGTESGLCPDAQSHAWISGALSRYAENGLKKKRYKDIMSQQEQQVNGVETPGSNPQLNGVNPPANTAPNRPEDLPQETLDFAARMFDAARNGDETLLCAAVDAGLPVNLTNHQGNTLLMLSTYAGHLPLSRALLSRGADPDRLNDQGQSIIAGAIFKSHYDLVKLLAEHKADPRAGKPNAIESAWMFAKDDVKDGEMSKSELLELLGAREEDKERMEREGVRIGPPVSG
ncbi:ankyrin [Moniliophthora roreri]|nr:ankyrin [Moniliophthora roreri]